MRFDTPRLPLLAAVLPAILVTAPSAGAQDWKGTGHIQGVLTEEGGKPIVDATVKANCPERGGGTTLKTDKKGRWALGGIAACAWEFDFEAAGYETKRVTAHLPSETARIPSVDISVKKAGPGPELANAAEKAQSAYKAGHYAEARAEYEALLAMRPDLAPMIHQQIGFSYIQEKQYDKAVEYLDKVLAADPKNAQIRAITAQAALEGGMVDRARQLLADLDESKITSPDIFYNMGVNFLNAKATEDALPYFGKAIKIDPTYVDAYYRRALGYLGQGKMAEAKADFKKVVELQPEGDMAAMSRKALEQLK